MDVEHISSSEKKCKFGDMFASIHNRHGLKLDNTFSNFPSSTMKYEFHDKHRRSPHLVVDKSVLLVMLFRLRLSTQIPFSNNDDVAQKTCLRFLENSC